MKLVYLKLSPMGGNKINVSEFENVKKMANAYVYNQNDRIKKICGKKDTRIQSITKIYTFPYEKPYQYQIFLIDPNHEKISDIKKQLLQIAKRQINEVVETYKIALEKIKKHLLKI